MLQEFIVTLIVVAALAYMAWRYLPAAWRQRLGRVHPRLAAGQIARDAATVNAGIQARQQRSRAQQGSQ